jgi:hypothetical protein
MDLNVRAFRTVQAALRNHPTEETAKKAAPRKEGPDWRGLRVHVPFHPNGGAKSRGQVAMPAGIHANLTDKGK